MCWWAPPAAWQSCWPMDACASTSAAPPCVMRWMCCWVRHGGRSAVGRRACSRGDFLHCMLVLCCMLLGATCPSLQHVAFSPGACTGPLPPSNAGEDFAFAEQVRPLRDAAPPSTRWVFATATLPEQVFMDLEEVREGLSSRGGRAVLQGWEGCPAGVGGLSCRGGRAGCGCSDVAR